MIDFFFDNISTAVLVQDSSHCYIAANKAAVKWIGQAKENIIGKTDYEIFDKVLANVLHKKTEEVWSSGKESILKISAYRKDIEEKEVIQNNEYSIEIVTFKKYLISSQNNYIKYMTIEISVTYSLSEKEEENEYKISIENQLRDIVQFRNEMERLTKIGSWEYYPKQDALILSDQLYKIYDLRKNEKPIELSNIVAFMPPENQEQMQQFIENALKIHRPYSLEHKIHLKDNSEKWIHSFGNVILDKDSNVVKLLGIAQDITQRKEAQIDSIRKNQELDEKNKQLQKYIDSNLQLENFAYIASHDLREPLRTIGSFSQLLDKKYNHKLDAEGQEFLQFIIQATHNMNVLITDLLEYSRVNMEGFLPEKINLPTLCSEICDSLQRQIYESDAVIEYENIPTYIYCHHTKIKQLLQNLITNAIKFRKKDTPPYIKISCKENNIQWHFIVSDNGIGIKEEFYDKVFVLFKKLHTRAQYEGTGLGLAICKKIVEQHGGEIWLESKIDIGSDFHFTLRKP